MAVLRKDVEWACVVYRTDSVNTAFKELLLGAEDGNLKYEFGHGEFV